MAYTHPSVITTFVALQSKMEGDLLFMYLDRKGLVTTGVGNLIDSIADAQRLPWKRSDGTLASPDEVAAAWRAVKARTDLMLEGGGAYAGVTSLRLTQADVEDLIRKKLLSNEAELMKRLPTFPHLTADAQMGVHSVAWAAGPDAHAPHLFAALGQAVPDYLAAAYESSDNFRDLAPDRKRFNKAVFTNAAVAQKIGADITRLFYPTMLNMAMEAEQIATFQEGAGLGAAFWVGVGVVGFGLWKIFGARA